MSLPHRDGVPTVNERRKSMRELEVTEESVETTDLVLERKATGEILDELLLMEMDLLRRYKAHKKERIVEALRGKQD